MTESYLRIYLSGIEDHLSSGVVIGFVYVDFTTWRYRFDWINEEWINMETGAKLYNIRDNKPYLQMEIKDDGIERDTTPARDTPHLALAC